ncbi:MAG: manganese efflux pump [Clostridia bacterium]|nr:manganese efflux pump [Clostridia bacterium]MBQ4609344.1 manganese efflux pump [Clostridia bacterium]MBQ6859237.1 manganese efflux pump [Clostridia bacterium]MBQ7052756.1 manganese efflux pump [Clostridia bacterium]
MGLWELFVIALGLSMDAFAVSICKGLSVRRCGICHMLICGLYFGIFQGIMPLIGYLLGSQFESLVTSIAPYIAFALLAFIGYSMIKEAKDADEESVDDDFSAKAMVPLAIATSIDALAVGVSFAFLQVDIVPAVSFIGVTTFLCCLVGVKIGSIFGNKYKAGAEFFGGLVLILMGFKILMEHLVG